MNNYLNALEKMSCLLKQENKKKELKNIEQQIFSCDETLALIAKFQKAQDDFNFILKHFQKDDVLKEKYKTILIKEKKVMDSHLLIKKYNSLYNDITEPTLYLENELRKILNDGEIKKC